jgi:hypothetical protein
MYVAGMAAGCDAAGLVLCGILMTVRAAGSQFGVAVAAAHVCALPQCCSGALCNIVPLWLSENCSYTAAIACLC